MRTRCTCKRGICWFCFLQGSTCDACLRRRRKCTRCNSSPPVKDKSIGSVLALALLSAPLCMSSSCGVLRKVERESNESFAAVSVAVRSDSLVMTMDRVSGMRMQERTDSITTGYDLVIWPKGKFSISKDGQFEGEALKVSMRGQHTAVGKSSQLDQQENQKGVVKRLAKEDLREAVSKKKQVVLKKNPALKWALILLAVAIGFNYYYYYYYYKRQSR